MTKINQYTKKYEQLKREYEKYQRLSDNDLFDFYKTVSQAKYRSYVSWLDWIYENFEVTSAVKVLGGNCHQYTLGFEYQDSETGVINFCKITRDNVYSIEV